MTRLYGFKWISKEGHIPIGEDGAIDPEHDNIDGFRLWYAETKHLTNEEWRRGVKRCEDEFRSKAKIGDENWPPNYIELVEYCREPKKPKYFYGVDESGRSTLLPEPEDVKRERKERGLQHTTRILSIFDDE